MYVNCLIHQYLFSSPTWVEGWELMADLKNTTLCKGIHSSHSLTSSQTARPRHVRVAIWIFLSAESIQQSHGWLTHPGGKARSGKLRWDTTDEPKRRQSCTTSHGFHHSGQPKIGSKMANPKKGRLLKGFIFTGNPYTPQKLRQTTNLFTQKKPHSAPRLDLLRPLPIERPKATAGYHKIWTILMWKFGQWLSSNHSKFSSTISAQELRIFFVVPSCCDHLFVTTHCSCHSTSPHGRSLEMEWFRPTLSKGQNATKFRVAEAIDTVPTQNISIAWSIPLSLWLAMTCSAGNRFVCECTLIVCKATWVGTKRSIFALLCSPPPLLPARSSVWQWKCI